MVPGNISLIRQIGEFDTFVSSGFFPILPGERQRMAISVAITAGGINVNADIQNVIEKLHQAELAYNADYQFAQAPLQVTLRAVPGDERVTLYWDDIAEYSFDRYIDRIGGNPNDFEGYRVYRSTDPAFLDSKVITDAFGVETLLKPIAQFDLNDGISGLHPVDINGVKFFLGDDTGLEHEFVDTDVINGQQYYYAVTGYDFGYIPGNIPPTETPIRVDVSNDGNVKTSSNVAIVRPTSTAAGYIPPEVTFFEHTKGGSNSLVGIEIIDPNALKDGELYELSFEDTTIITPENEEILTTKSYSLFNKTTLTYVVENDTNINQNSSRLVTDGFKLILQNESQVEIDEEKTKWNNPDVYSFDFGKMVFINDAGIQKPNDYLLIFDEPGFETSYDTTLGFPPFGVPLPARSVNFKVYNLTESRFIKFGFYELDGNNGRFSIHPTNSNLADAIYFLEENENGILQYTWQLVLNKISGTRNPQAGDSLQIFLIKPFLSYDLYTFSLKKSGISNTLAQDQLKNIRVVPNPYIAAETWEPRNPYTSGRGPREIHFINLPNVCTIRIYNVNGILINTIEHESAYEDGTEVWDVLSSEKYEISYGLYLYHIDAPGIGETTGTFAIIK